jgi:hypothetical protein
MADELRAGRPLPLGWKVHVADIDATILATIKFADVALDRSMPVRSRTPPELVARAKETFHRARTSTRELQNNLEKLRDQVRTLSQLNGSVSIK